MDNVTYESVAPGQAEQVLAEMRNGTRFVVRTAMRVVVLDAKVLARFEAAGCWLLKNEGNGYRVRTGKTSVYLIAGQLEKETR